MIRGTTQCRAAVIPLVVASLFTTAPVLAQSGAKDGEWRHWGADSGTTHYSPLDQINRDNVGDLEIAWRWRTDNLGPRPDFEYRATPLMVGGVLYTTAGTRRDVVAIDGETGETLWMFRYDEGSRAQRAPNRGLSGRGVAYWADGQGNERLFYVTLGYRLVALNPKTGRPVPDFGQDGVVDLWEELDQDKTPQEGDFSLTSAPAVVGDVVVVGAAMRQSEIAGFPRGFDVQNGQRLWAFHTIPQGDEFGNDSWEGDSWRHTGNTGVWAPVSVDEDLGYVYLGVETPTNDWYGGRRLGDNLFANSLVCVDAETGERVWHFQLTHHDIWDYDIPAAANLVDITVKGKPIKAVVQVSKQAFAYVFDRVTGEPVWPIEEKPVPPSDISGERASPTQPFPTKPPPFDRQGITLEDLIDLTPELHAQALEIAKKYRLGSLYTPSSLIDPDGTQGTLMLPSANGGASWQGAAADPETGILYIPSTTNVWLLGLLSDESRNERRYVTAGAGYNNPAIQPQGLPLVKPPWSRITAIDLNTGERLWMTPNGAAPTYISDHPALQGVDLSNAGTGDNSGLLVTKTLLFAGQGAAVQGVHPGAGGRMFRAIDKKTGEVIAEFELPANQSGVPMTYMLGGKQYIVVAVSTQGNLPGELVALALP